MKVLMLIIFLLFGTIANGQIPVDTVVRSGDSIHQSKLQKLLSENIFLRKDLPAVALPIHEKKHGREELLFYIIGGLVLFLGFFRLLYAGYFDTMFRVFFNTSLRQNQLTDILLQAKLPSLILNIFFTLSIGMFTWLVLRHYHIVKDASFYMIPLCVLMFCLIYTVKFSVLKILGWVTGMTEETDIYIFVIFLINKIIGIMLLPLAIILAFAPHNFQDGALIGSYFLLGLLFLSRYVRSYGLLQYKLSVSRFHFLLYIIAVEILPTLMLSKAALNLIG